MKKILCGLSCVLVCFVVAQVCLAQTTGGTMRGMVTDTQGAAVAGAKVTITNTATNVAFSLDTNSSGIYNYPDLLVGTYSVTVESQGFQKYVRGGIQIFANQVTEVNAQLQVGAVTTTVEVTSTAPVIETGTSQISNDFSSLQVTQVPNADPAGSQLYLALLAPGTTAQGAGVLGEGGSIGGARPRFNSFTIDGVDDNRIDLTGHEQYVIPESVSEFNLLTNQFSAEYGHSAGGQFNTITKSGSNAWHGDAWEFNNNRHYNAFDNLQKRNFLQDGTPKPRSDFNRFGADAGGPIIRNKLFIYGAFQRIVQGLAAQAVAQQAPTADGLATLQSLAFDSQVNDILKQFPIASTQNRTENVFVPGSAISSGGISCSSPGGCPIPIGTISPLAPSFLNQWDFMIRGDAALGKHALTFDVLYDRSRSPNVNVDTPQPQFTGTLPGDTRKYLFKDTWAVSSQFVNEFRTSYSRLVAGFAVPAAFANFPNAEVDSLGVNVGPQGCSPQSTILNTYEFVDNMSYVRGKHNLKWGAKWYHVIAPNVNLPRSRGVWDYQNLNQLVNDFVGNGLNGTLRGAGTSRWRGNQDGASGFVQDDWKITRQLTLNLGLRYEWNGVPLDDNLQKLNAISSLPDKFRFGAFHFGSPKGDYNNIAPRVGLAYDPTGSGKWAIRAGFGISYDVTPQNFAINSLPPQLQTEQNPDITCGLASPPAWCANFDTGPFHSGGNTGQGFLAGGGLAQVNVPCTDVSSCRGQTGSDVLDIIEPKVLTWSLGVQHDVGWNSTVEVRYVGTRSLELPIQARLNIQSGFDAGLGALPTYLSTSAVPAAVPSPAVTLADWDNFFNNSGGANTPTGCADPNIFEFGVQGFCGSLVTGFPPLANGIYQGASVDFNHRVGHGLTLRANYTYSRNMDNATNELFSSRVNPRRPQDWRQLRDDWGRSTLDVPSKFALSWVYDLPGNHGDNSFIRGLSNGWQWQGTWQAYNGIPVTVLNGTNVSGAGSAGQRPVLNPSAKGIGVSDVNFVCNAGAGGAVTIVADPTTCGSGDDTNIVGYVAQDLTARYIVAQTGTKATVRRDSFRSPGVNLWNMGIEKDTKIGERVNLALSVSAYDVFNHRNYSLAPPDVLQAGVNSLINVVNNALSTTYTNINDAGAGFLDKKQFTGGSRVLRLGIKITF